MTKPRKAIRRFDVFAEFMRQKALANGMSQEEAKGYGIWMAKVTASPDYEGSHREELRARADLSNQIHKPESQWHEFDGEPQTDQVFDAEIVSRMGNEFYEQIFSQDIGDALQKGLAYQDIRDEIRKDWKP